MRNVYGSITVLTFCTLAACGSGSSSPSHAPSPEAQAPSPSDPPATSLPQPTDAPRPSDPPATVNDPSPSPTPDPSLAPAAATPPAPPPPPSCPGKSDAPPATTGSIINVAAGGNLQAAIDGAQPGDEIVLAAGATFTGSFHLPNKAGAQFVTIRSALDHLPAAGTRVTPADAPSMAKLVGSTMGEAPLRTDAGAHHYRIVGLEIAGTPGVYAYNVVTLGSGFETDLASVPHDLIVDRSYIHGDPKSGVHQAIAMNSASTTITNSWISDAKGVGQEAQAIACWNGPGPFTLLNNHLEGAGENVIFGGQDPSIANLVPSDIVMKWNHFYKPLAWKPSDPSYAGTHWLVKNLLELKNARRVTIEGNLFENSWADAQSGEAALFTPRNQNGGAPWSTVESVTFTNNEIRHTGGGISVMGHDDLQSSQAAHDFTISNNHFWDIGGSTWGGWGRFLLVDSGTSAPGPSDVRVDHNTVVQVSDVLVSGTPQMVVNHPNFVFTNNLVNNGPRGVVGDGTSPGDATLSTYFTGAIFSGNALVGGAPATYVAHPDNQFPASLVEAGLADPSAGSLSPTSPLKAAATDGKDVGVNDLALDSAAACRTP